AEKGKRCVDGPHRPTQRSSQEVALIRGGKGRASRLGNPGRSGVLGSRREDAFSFLRLTRSPPELVLRCQGLTPVHLSQVSVMAAPRLNSVHLEPNRREEYRRARDMLLNARGWQTLAAESPAESERLLAEPHTLIQNTDQQPASEVGFWLQDRE